MLKLGANQETKVDGLCQKLKDKPGEQSVKRDVLLGALHASRAVPDEELRAQNAGPGGKPPGRSVEPDAKRPAVRDAQVEG